MKQSFLLIGTAMLFLSTGCSADEAGTQEAGSQTEVVGSDAANETSKHDTSVASAPALAEGYDWTMRVNDEARVQNAILAYEIDGTDDQALRFVCEDGGNRIFARISGGPTDLSAITLASGGETLQLTGKTEVDEMPDFTSEEIAGGSPFIRAFLANGWMRMTADGAVTDMAATGSGKELIQRFVKFCTG